VASFLGVGPGGSSSLLEEGGPTRSRSDRFRFFLLFFRLLALSSNGDGRR
jgi:hypothetical protein